MGCPYICACARTQYSAVCFGGAIHGHIQGFFSSVRV
eukprot:CAMPEP_0194422028 /NCGR_PEP_ID=MMETSP0176-20130528/21294_1 /TAXON_ID=216777 /ORGANISM="Proboscia alata, Strain PI-D3" /LENGTH=36 /DNA_ID= /DNA_START= /DNA_END= /DNA_ORIENTATION=